MEVCYTLRDPDGEVYDKTSIQMPIDKRIFEFGDIVAEANGFPNCKAAVYPSEAPNLKAYPRANKLSIYNNKSGTEESPFHIHLKQKPATAAVQDQSAPIAEETQEKKELRAFFETDLKTVDFEEEGSEEISYFLKLSTLHWTGIGLNFVYWRACYSYLLCSVVGAFEKAYEERKKARRDPRTAHVKGLSMVLTGVQGTGKSVLGTFIALVMSKAFGWCVHYQWGTNEHTHKPEEGQDADKSISIRDLSTAVDGDKETIFELLVSSCNEDRWKERAQQGSWATQGNLVFIDTAPKEELVAMGERMTGKKPEDIIENMKLAGGVPRLCLQEHQDTRSRIETAIRDLDVLQSLRQLDQLKDAMPDHSGDKLYPGLLVHVKPTDPFRNQYVLQASSLHVSQCIASRAEAQSANDIESMLADLMKIPKARSFAGLIWVPLFSKKIKSEGTNLLIHGSELPMNDPSCVRKLYQGNVQDMKIFEFKTLDDFKTEFSDWINNVSSDLAKNASAALLAKAQDDNFIAIDAILVFLKEVSNGNSKQYQLVVAGQQLTVAQTTPDLKEMGVKGFSEAVQWIREGFGHHFTPDSDNIRVRKEIWFVQPEQCLATFGFSTRQALVFEDPRSAESQVAAVSMFGRKRKRPSSHKDYVEGEQKKQSNDPSYWPDHVRDVKQLVAIAKFTSENPRKQEEFATNLLLTQAESQVPAQVCVVTPNVRPWGSTIDAFNAMARGGNIAKNLIDVMRQDLEDERGWLLLALGAQATLREPEAAE